MFKYLLNFLLLLPFIISINACSPKLSNLQDPNTQIMCGTWEMDGHLYIFEENGRLVTLNREDISGNTWQLKGKTLILTFIDSPANPPRESRWNLTSLTRTRMLAENAQKEVSVWTRPRNTIALLSGEFYYLERMALPPEVIVNIELTQDNGKKLINSALYEFEGITPLPFNFYYLTENVDKTKSLELSARINYKENTIFKTEVPLIIPQDTKQVPPIRLIRTTQEDSAQAALIAPLAYSFVKEHKSTLYSAQLYLEANNFFFLIQNTKNADGEKEFITWGHWNQVGRGYNIELLFFNEEVITGAVKQEESLTFETLPYFDIKNISFEKTPLTGEVTRPFDIVGSLEKVGEDYLFTPCGATSASPLTGNIEEIAQIYNEDAHSVHINTTFSRPNVFHLQSVHSLENTDLCPLTTPINTLTDTYWRLTSLNQSKTTNFGDAEPHLILRKKDATKEKGEGSGSDGCNSFFFSWEAELDSIMSFQPGGSTMRLCQEKNVEKQAQEYMQALAQTNAYTLKGSVLELKKDDEVLASFEAVNF